SHRYMLVLQLDRQALQVRRHQVRYRADRHFVICRTLTGNDGAHAEAFGHRHGFAEVEGAAGVDITDVQLGSTTTTGGIADHARDTTGRGLYLNLDNTGGQATGKGKAAFVVSNGGTRQTPAGPGAPVGEHFSLLEHALYGTPADRRRWRGVDRI